MNILFSFIFLLSNIKFIFFTEEFLISFMMFIFFSMLIYFFKNYTLLYFYFDIRFFYFVFRFVFVLFVLLCFELCLLCVRFFFYSYSFSSFRMFMITNVILFFHFIEKTKSFFQSLAILINYIKKANIFSLKHLNKNIYYFIKKEFKFNFVDFLLGNNLYLKNYFELYLYVS